MPAIALLVKESLSWLIKVVTTPRNIEYILAWFYDEDIQRVPWVSPKQSGL